MQVYRHAADAPFERRAWLRNVGNVTYSRELMGYGQFQFDLPANDAGVLPGDLIAITHPTLPPFVGLVDRIEEAYEEPEVQIVGRELVAVFSERLTPQEKIYQRDMAHLIALDLIASANARNHTGIILANTSASGTTDGEFPVRADDVLSALNALADFTGEEWEVYYATGSTLGAVFRWARTVGLDLSHSTQLAGKMIARAEYTFDAVSGYDLVQIVGSQGTFADRPSAAAGIGLPDIGAVRQAVRSPKATQQSGVGTRREIAILEATLSSGPAVQERARKAIQSVRSGQEVIGLTVSPSADWSQLLPGNIITVRLAGMRFGANVVAGFRIMGYQVDEDELELVGTAVPLAA